ncbi:MAG: hypothetical protein ACR2FM_01635 [Candidatus Saccharimonadales bacterium]
MSKYKQERTNHVSLEEYNGSKEWRATSEEIAEPLRRGTDDEDRARGRFTMRLLELDHSGAVDHLVELVAAEDAGELVGPLVVTVRTLLKDGEKGRLKTCHVAVDGIILSNNINTPADFENGYFVGGEGVGEDELQDVTLQLRIPKEKPALKALELDLLQNG